MYLRLNLFRSFILQQLFVLIKTDFYQYHTKYPINEGDHTCLYRNTIEFGGRVSHLIPYCIRTPIVSRVTTLSICYGKNSTFDQLKKNNVSADQLMKWSAPIDLITDYMNYLINGFDATQLFCNCSQLPHSFGTGCQYQFVAKTFSFNNLVNGKMAGKYRRDIRNLTEEYDVTCHMISNCTTYTGFCLDWCQICNGKRDCTNGIDEELCLEKELSECNEKTHYRCRSGHCIPRAFAFDLTAGCPDWDDEQSCTESFSAECEEHSCGLSGFSCEDGQCLEQSHRRRLEITCRSQRDIL